MKKGQEWLTKPGNEQKQKCKATYLQIFECNWIDFFKKMINLD